MNGRRIDITTDKHFVSNMQPGDYGLYEGRWYCCTPKQGFAYLTGHSDPSRDWEVTEHEDGTITVKPSINQVGRWHGYLEKGIWREC